MKSYWLCFLWCAIVVGLSMPLLAQQTKEQPAGKTRTLARLVWQDKESQTLRWGDLQRTDNEWKLVASDVPGVPKLDTETQSYVQMEPFETSLIAGIHDDDKGTIGSGWIALDLGIEMEAHGDHFHARFVRQPKVVHTQLDTNQGNPAHVYRYGNKIFIANDAKNGFTVVAPPKAPSTKWNGTFYLGGGNHITLATVADQWCYATWADREGENTGRVDIVSLSSGASQGVRSFKLPSGGLHGATSNSGKVFFAPSDGVCMINGDGKDVSPESIQHISLGADAESGKAYRTGAFTNQRNWVMFQYGAGAEAALGMIDASKPKPTLVRLSIPTEEGLSLSTPECMTASNGKEIAWLIQHRRGSEKTEKLIAVELDPNGDKNFTDAKISGTLELGPSDIEGHSGMHEIAVLPNRRAACITNPGDGTVWIVSLSNLEVLAKLSVGGSPTRVVAFGG